MGIRKYNDMKEHNISRIHSIRHPSPVNTHQSLCAHNLITKHAAVAKQPPYFRGLLQTQTRGDGCLYSGKKNVNVRTVEEQGGLFTCDSYRYVANRLLFRFSASLRPSQQLQSVPNSPSTWWELWLRSSQFPAEFPLQKRGSMQPEYGYSPEKSRSGAGDDLQWALTLNCGRFCSNGQTGPVSVWCCVILGSDVRFCHFSEHDGILHVKHCCSFIRIAIVSH